MPQHYTEQASLVKRVGCSRQMYENTQKVYGGTVNACALHLQSNFSRLACFNDENMCDMVFPSNSRPHQANNIKILCFSVLCGIIWQISCVKQERQTLCQFGKFDSRIKIFVFDEPIDGVLPYSMSKLEIYDAVCVDRHKNQIVYLMLYC